MIGLKWFDGLSEPGMGVLAGRIMLVAYLDRDLGVLAGSAVVSGRVLGTQWCEVPV